MQMLFSCGIFSLFSNYTQKITCLGFFMHTLMAELPFYCRLDVSDLLNGHFLIHLPFSVFMINLLPQARLNRESFGCLALSFDLASYLQIYTV